MTDKIVSTMSEEEFVHYEKYLDYDYTYAVLTISVKLPCNKERRGVKVKFTEEASGKNILEAIKMSQISLINSVKELLTPYIEINL